MESGESRDLGRVSPGGTGVLYGTYSNLSVRVDIDSVHLVERDLECS